MRKMRIYVKVIVIEIVVIMIIMMTQKSSTPADDYQDVLVNPQCDGGYNYHNLIIVVIFMIMI